MPADPSIILRPLAPEDLDAAHGLSRSVSWPHRIEDWRLMARLGEGFAAVDASGRLQGVALWWPQGSEYATLGMVIVSPAVQKAGIGRRLMGVIVDAAAPRRIQLNATAEGLRLYRSFGFEEVGGIHQHHGILAPGAEPVAPGTDVRPLTDRDHPALRALDRTASGTDRRAILDALLPLSRGYAADAAGRMSGFLLVRDFGRGRLLGPLVADDEPTALALLSTAAVDAGGFLRADIPEDADDMAAWLEGAGLPRVGQVRTMLRGPVSSSLGPARVFGLASQALG